MIATVLILLTLILLIFTLIPLSKSEAWWVRGLEFPRLLLTTLGGMLVIIQALLFDFGMNIAWAMLGVSVLCTLYHCSWILPYTVLYPKEVLPCNEVDSKNSIRILVANVLQTNKSFDKLLKLIRENNPDIFVTLETNHEWERQLDELQDNYPHTVKCPLENLYGMHVYSRLPLIDPEIKFLVLKDIPSIHTQLKLRSGQKISIHFVHPLPPSPKNEDTSERDTELLVVGNSLTDKESPVIVTGDLNDVAWSKTTKHFLKTCGLLDPRVGRGMFNTFNAKHWFIRWPLDHLFHSKHFLLSDIKRLPDFGSDHFPVLVELVFRPK